MLSSWLCDFALVCSLLQIFTCFCFCVLQKIRNMHNEQLIGIRGEEEMEMSDDDMEDSTGSNSKDFEDSGKK